jgi:DNA modification methylase
MLFLKPSEIIVAPNRQRRLHDISKEQELAHSIETIGLLHPPVVRTTPEGYVLVAGERRYRAISSIIDFGGSFRVAGETTLPAGVVPVLALAELSEDAAEEAELDENIKRVDLTWQERAAAVARLAALRGRQNALTGAPKPTVASIAAELERQPASVREDMLVAAHLSNPEVAKAKTAGDALKALKKVEQRAKMVLRAEAVQSSAIPLHATHKLILGDAIEELRKMADASANIVLSDPPYGMGADSFGDVGDIAPTDHRYDDSLESWKALMAAFVPELFRVCADGAAVYLFCDFDRFSDLRAFLARIGFRVHRTPILWLKPNGQRVPWPKSGPRRAYELCLFAMKGEHLVNKLENDYVIAAPDENLGHSAQKPLDLMRNLLRRSAKPGDVVLDPFMGTASVLPAAHELLCTYIGIELEAASFGIATTRLEKLK